MKKVLVIFSVAVAAAALFIQAIGVTAAMPIPNYGPGQILIKADLASLDEDFARQMLNLGQTMMASGHENYQKPEFYYWMVNEYVIGHIIDEVAYKKLNGDQPLPDDIISTKTIMHGNPHRDNLESGLYELDQWAEKQPTTGADMKVHRHDCPPSTNSSKTNANFIANQTAERVSALSERSPRNVQSLLLKCDVATEP